VIAEAVVVAVTTQVTRESEIESDSVEWEQAIQLRLMELDVDPGNDAGSAFGKRTGI
jgi:hypothetical protein